MRLLGLDPGLRATGWGVIEANGNSLSHVADGAVRPDVNAPLSERLAALYSALRIIVEEFAPDEAAVEETFANRNPASTLKLGQARGVVMLAPAQAGIPVAEYSANVIKKSLVGAGHADKGQIGAMVRMLLPGSATDSADAADALAVAVCHAHHLTTQRRWAAGSAREARL
jgi:crossover junction endodeoxyribonuclease RuvC